MRERRREAHERIEMSIQVDLDTADGIAQALEHYDDCDHDTGDLVYRYAERFDGTDMFDAAGFARDMWNLMFKDGVEEDSPIDDALHGATGLGWDAAINSLVTTLRAGQEERRIISEVLSLHLDSASGVPDRADLIEGLQRLQRLVSNRLQDEMHGGGFGESAP
jgi:hypothetical protein